jgi:hypothetical protein
MTKIFLSPFGFSCFFMAQKKPKGDKMAKSGDQGQVTPELHKIIPTNARLILLKMAKKFLIYIICFLCFS